jgi:hypothetical protein
MRNLVDSKLFMPLIQAVAGAFTSSANPSVSLVATQAGSLIVAGIYYPPNIILNSYSDSGSQTYSAASTVFDDGNERSLIIYKVNSIAGITSVTFNFASAANCVLFGAEVSAINAFDAVSSASAGGPSWSATAVSTLHQVDELYLMVGIGSGSGTDWAPTVTSDWLVLTGTGIGGTTPGVAGGTAGTGEILLARKFVSSLGSYGASGTFAFNNAGISSGWIVAFSSTIVVPILMGQPCL